MTPTKLSPRRTLNLRDEALLLLEHRGAILEAAREISRSLRERSVPGAIIGGIAVLLHGHVRTTTDIDIVVHGPLDEAGSALEAIGFVKDPSRGQFIRDGLPVHLLPFEVIGMSLGEFIEIDGVITVTLPNLVAMKLLSGIRNRLRAKDLGDVIDLIRARRLTGSLASSLPREIRMEYRKLVKEIGADKPRHSL